MSFVRQIQSVCAVQANELKNYPRPLNQLEETVPLFSTDYNRRDASGTREHEHSDEYTFVVYTIIRSRQTEKLQNINSHKRENRASFNR